MNHLISEFSFFKAGQGSFYGGRIFDFDSKKCWSIVYDCGTSKFVKGNIGSLNEEIDYFKDIQICGKPRNHKQQNEIDILFISHLDYDHVSGIVNLINGVHVKKIVIPYFPKEIRRFMMLSFAIKRNNLGQTQPSFNFQNYIDFLRNPYSYLYEIADNNPIIFVVNNEAAPLIDDSIEINDNDITVVGTSTNNNSDELENIEIGMNSYKNNLQFYFKKRWEFTCHYKPVKSSVILRLEKSLSKIIDKEINQINENDIIDIVTTNREKAHSCYKKYLDDVNAHGLVLIHGPINFKYVDFNYVKGKFLQDNSYYRRSPYAHPFYSKIKNINKSFLGTVLMGDTSINPTNNPIVFRDPKIISKIKNSHIFQVPHHGSHKNWNFKKYKSLKLGENLRILRINVCNFGIGNIYGHPSRKVLKELSKNLVLNTQFLRFTYHYFITY